MPSRWYGLKTDSPRLGHGFFPDMYSHLFIKSIPFQLIEHSETTADQKVLLLIEKQAIIQVLLHQLATSFRDPKKLQDVSSYWET